MDFQWSDEQELLRASMRRLGEQLTRDFSADQLGPGGPAWNRCAEAGLFDLGRHGGNSAPADLLTAVAALEVLGNTVRDNGLLFTLMGQICCAVYPVSAFCDAAQQERYLAGLCGGSLVGASAVTETGAGSDLSSMSTRYRRSGETFILEGAKMFITCAPRADLFLVLARDGDRPADQPARLSTFLVPRDTPGLALGQQLETMGLNSAPLGEVVLDECPLPAEALVGKHGAGGMMFQAVLEWERVAVAACHVGTMERVLAETIKHTRRRKQFGQAIIRHQQVGARLADAYADLQSSRLLLYHAAWQKRGGRSAPLEAALVKLVTSESYVRASLSALQLRGAAGYMTEAGTEGQVRDALASTLYSGTSEMLRNLIVSLI